MSLSSEKNAQRRRARKQAMQMLFMRDFADDSSTTPQNIAHVMDDVVPEEYASVLDEGVLAKQLAIDDAIQDASDNWVISRMPSTDRAIIRIAVYELMFCDNVPNSASINEAIEMAREFGAEDDSYKFVNGVLGKIDQQLADDSQLDCACDDEQMKGE